MRRMSFLLPALILFLAASLPLILIPGPVLAQMENGRFYLRGDGNIQIKNMHSGREVSVSLLLPDGSLNEEGLEKIDELFGFKGSRKGEHISPRLLLMLDHFSDRVAPGKTINMISGYRSPEYNASLRDKGGNVAKTSLHMDGMALDFYIDGVDGKQLWEIIRAEDCCGIGHYGGASVHLDSARPRFWEASTSKVRTGDSDYNRRVYLSTDFDRYRPGDGLTLSLSSVSDFGFGVARTISFVKEADGLNAAATAGIENPGNADCLFISDREASRFLAARLPSDLPAGKYRVKVDFCRKPFEQMPDFVVSNQIELIGR